MASTKQGVRAGQVEQMAMAAVAGCPEPGNQVRAPRPAQAASACQAGRHRVHQGGWVVLGSSVLAATVEGVIGMVRNLRSPAPDRRRSTRRTRG